MEKWFIFALLSPLLVAVNNVIDQLMVRRYFPNNGEVFLYLGCITYFIICPIIFILFPFISETSNKNIFTLTALGFFSLFIWIPYMWSLERDDVTMVMPIIQLSPILVFILSYLFFSETIDTIKLLGSLIVIIASILIAVDFKRKEVRGKTLFFMILCTMGISIQTITIRYFTIDDINWMIISFWMAVGFGIGGFFMLLIVKKYRESAINALIKSKGSIIILTSIQEIVYFISILLSIMALSTSPSSGIVQSLLALNTVYIMIFSAIFHKFQPRYFEKLGIGKIFWWRLGCIALILLGVYIIYNGL